MATLFPLVLLLPLGLAACAAPPVARPWAVELEGAAVWQTRNDAAVPGDTGTRVAVDDVTGSGPFGAGRAYLSWQPAERHELRALAAPLSIAGRGELDRPVAFGGRSFAPGPVQARYRFDSYRLTWRYLVHRDDAWSWRLGVTGKIRDAEIALTQGPTTARKTDLGFVPLLHVAGDWRFAPDWRLSLDVDGAWAPQGRAVDAALKAWWQVGDGTELGLGYRTIEGGADNDEVFTFAWLHQAIVSMRFTF
ncbi:MAG: hypothetical protein AB7O97_07735 [Planctomycetota bacterium]